MSGVRQHYIPRFLQRGFAKDPLAEHPVTMAYRKGRDIPFEVRTSNIGLEKYFYSDENSASIDDAITDRERTYAKLVSGLRQFHPQEAQAQLIAELLAHLENRTRNLRASFTDATSHVVNQIIDFIEDPQAFGTYMERRVLRDPKLMEDAFREELRRRRLPLSLAGDLLARIQPHISSFVPSIADNLSKRAAMLRDTFIPKLEEAAKKGQLQALGRGLASPTKAKIYEALCYRTFDLEFPLPLGDCLTLIQVAGARRFKPFFEKDDAFEAIYLPLTSSRVLVGSAPGFEPRLEELPVAIARSSLEVFICNSDHAVLRSYHSQIGSNAYIVSKADLDAMLTEVLQNGA